MRTAMQGVAGDGWGLLEVEGGAQSRHRRGVSPCPRTRWLGSWERAQASSAPEPPPRPSISSYLRSAGAVPSVLSGSDQHVGSWQMPGVDGLQGL